MRTPVVVVSMLLLGSSMIHTHLDVSAATATRTARGPALAACHRAGAPISTARGNRSDDAARRRHRVALPSRMRQLDVAHLAAIVAVRMPGHDVALHRALASVIDDEARRAGLDPLLVLALIHVESSFDPGAVSYAGAVGLMQLRERTLHREIERAGLAPADPRDPVANVRAGIRYLRRLVKAFGSTDLALMAYNAGPNRILSYSRAGDIPERFQAYPKRIRTERERLRSVVKQALRSAATATPSATAS